jgi:hypothetical protein
MMVRLVVLRWVSLIRCISVLIDLHVRYGLLESRGRQLAFRSLWINFESQSARFLIILGHILLP